jgi:hypothetical protein
VVRVGWLPGRHHAAGDAGRIHDDHLDAVEVIGGQAVLPAQEAEGTAQDVTADADVGALAGRKRDAPAEEELAVHLADRGPGLDREGGSLRIVGDAGHQRGVDHHPHRRIRHEALQAVSSAARHDSQAVPHGFLHRVHHVLGGADEAHVVRPSREALVEVAAHEVGVSRILRPHLGRTAPKRAHVDPSLPEKNVSRNTKSGKRQISLRTQVVRGRTST